MRHGVDTVDVVRACHGHHRQGNEDDQRTHGVETPTNGAGFPLVTR
jgi:hypothetical protein